MHHYATKLVVGVVLCLVPSLMAQSVVYVDDDAPAGGDGTSWNTAYRYLQDALAKARSAPTTYPEIHIAAGTHCPDRSETGQAAAGDRNATFSLVSGVAVRGGYAGRGVTNPDARDVDAYTTTLSGDLASNDDVEPSATENSCQVVTGVDLAPTTLLDGVTITAGNANGGSPRDRGAGLHLLDAVVSVVDVTFGQNAATAAGGGVYFKYTSTPIPFVGCRFVHNSAKEGGAMYCPTGHATLTDCVFEGNVATENGGAFAAGGCQWLWISGCQFHRNSAGNSGGACQFWADGETTLVNCVLGSNSAVGNGGAIVNKVIEGGQMQLVNCTVVNNAAAQGGGIMTECSDCVWTHLDVMNCIFWGNAGGHFVGTLESLTPVSHSCIQGGWAGVGNIDSDPLFENEADGTWELQAGSPCIDAGNNAFVPTGTLTDARGSARFSDDLVVSDCRWAAETCGTAPVVDMGAYELGVTISGRITHDGAGVQGVGLTGVPGSCCTDANGYYSFGVSQMWSGSITPEKTGYTFTPATRSYSNLTENQAAQDYSVSQALLNISGHIDFNGQPMAGVVMEGLPGDPQTDVNGNYISILDSGWGGTVTPTKKGCAFSPASRSYGNLTSIQSAQDYTSSVQVLSISGYVKTNAGAGVSKAAIAGLSRYVTTDSSGYYTLSVTYGSAGTLVPSLAGYTFSPETRTYAVVEESQANQDYTALPVTYTISGRVTANGAAVADVVMSGLPGIPKTDADGDYSATVSYNWMGTVTPLMVGYKFPSRRYTGVRADQLDQDYAGSNQACYILGQVMAGDSPVSDVELSGLPTATKTDANGRYCATVGYGWTGEVTPTKVGYTFSPLSRSYNALFSSVLSQDYTATVTISGTISTPSGGQVASVTLVGFPESVTTSTSGGYTATVPYGWNGTVIPTKDGYTFFPAEKDYANVVSDSTDQDYTATPITFNVSGRITKEGVGFAGVVLVGLPGSPQTDADGNYAAVVNYAWDGVVWPNKVGYTFDPPNRRYTDLVESRVNQDYVGAVRTFEVSGQVTVSGVALPAVTLSGFPGVVQTDADGRYSTVVNYGWSGTVTLVKTGYKFSPSSRSYTNVVSAYPNQTYVATLIPVTIAGRVVANGVGVSGVVMSGLPGDPQTNSSGLYCVSVNYGWSGTVRPTMEDHEFTPPTRDYANVESHQTGQDYSAKLLAFALAVQSSPTGGSVFVSPADDAGESNGTTNFTRTYTLGTVVSLTAPAKVGRANFTKWTLDGADAGTSATLSVTMNAAHTAVAVYVTPTYTLAVKSEPSGVPIVVSPADNAGNNEGTTDFARTYDTETVVRLTAPAVRGDMHFSKWTRDGADAGTATTIEHTVLKSQTLTAVYAATISGRVMAGGKGLAGVVLSGLPGNPATDADGRYTATVNSGWSGTVTPTLTGYTFSPPSITYAAISAGQADQNYEASHLPVWVSGFVRTAAGTAVAGASITTTNGGGSAVTATTGQYSVSVPYLWSGRIQASKGGYTMVPESRELTGVSSNTYYQNFEARVNIAWYRDADNDGYGTTDDIMMAGVQPAGYVADGSDCNDGNGDAHPGGVEVCGNGVDEDCDGQDAACSRWYRDADGDGYGDAAQAVDALAQPEGYVADARDCDDTRKAVHVGATEVCGNSIDDDCDKQVDESCAATSIWYRDADKDGFGNAGISLQAVEQPSGYVADGSDCHDGKASIHPGATEVCGDGVDQDCDGQDAVCDTVDADGDGVPDASDLCSQTPASREVDANGCAASQRDSDADGVTDDVDACADTAAGTTVDATGCPVSSSTFTLRVQVTDGATAPAPAVYDSGTTVAVYAPDAAEGYHFDHWSGDASGSDNPISMVMDADKSLTANYAQDSEDQSTGPACASGALAGGVGIAVGLLLLQTAASVVLRKWCLFRFRCLWHRRLACACTGGTPVPQEKMQTA